MYYLAICPELPDDGWLRLWSPTLAESRLRVGDHNVKAISPNTPSNEKYIPQVQVGNVEIHWELKANENEINNEKFITEVALFRVQWSRRFAIVVFACGTLWRICWFDRTCWRRYSRAFQVKPTIVCLLPSIPYCCRILSCFDHRQVASSVVVYISLRKARQSGNYVSRALGTIEVGLMSSKLYDMYEHSKTSPVWFS
jgi:hypothetical protein